MSAYAASFAEGLRPDPLLNVSEWADKFRILPSKGAAEPGRFRTQRTPYLREIMDCLSPQSPVQRIVFMKSSQCGGTEMGLNWIGSVIHMYPAPMMIIQPDLILAERFSKQRVTPMVEATPELAALISPARERDSGNTILLKEFRGGVLVISGANSGASLRQMPIRFLFADEVSGYTSDADGDTDDGAFCFYVEVGPSPEQQAECAALAEEPAPTAAGGTASSWRMARCSLVCGMMPSSAAMTSSPRSMPVAPAVMLRTKAS